MVELRRICSFYVIHVKNNITSNLVTIHNNWDKKRKKKVFRRVKITNFHLTSAKKKINGENLKTINAK